MVTVIADEAALQPVYDAIVAGADISWQCSMAAKPYPEHDWLVQHLTDPCWMIVGTYANDVPQSMAVVQRDTGRVTWMCFAANADKAFCASLLVAKAYDETGSGWGWVENDDLRQLMVDAYGAHLRVEGHKVTWIG